MFLIYEISLNTVFCFCLYGLFFVSFPSDILAMNNVVYRCGDPWPDDRPGISVGLLTNFGSQSNIYCV